MPFTNRHRHIRITAGLLPVAVLCIALAPRPAWPQDSQTMDFPTALARVDSALRNNPHGASAQALDSCLHRRNFAARLYDSGQQPRAMRSLLYCFDLLRISKVEKKAEIAKKPSMEEVQARAADEIARASSLTPDIDNGLRIYRDCALCHEPEGWGLHGGLVPQIAGQHRTVVIKQLADIRAGNRDGTLMLPYASVDAIGGAQAVADVAGYIDTLEMTVENGKGPGSDLALGEKLYAENCARCHGESGEGNPAAAVPRIHAQHFNYLVRQFEWIRDGKRRNANAEMIEQIKGFERREVEAVLDYVSRLQPAPELQAPVGWRNPDFAGVRRFDPSAR